MRDGVPSRVLPYGKIKAVVGKGKDVGSMDYDNNERNKLEEKMFLDAVKEMELTYAQIVGPLSRKHYLPYPIALAVGTKEENYELFKRDIMDLDNVTVGQMRSLRSDNIAWQKHVMKQILTPETYQALQIGRMGPTNTGRLARFIWDKAMYRIESPK